MGLKYYRDFLSEIDLRENPKQKVIYHYLSVIVNATENLKAIDMLVRNYQLNLYVPLFKRYIGQSFLTDLVTDLSSCEELIAQGNRESIIRKIEGFADGKYGYKKDLIAARELNDLLIEREDSTAFKRKIKGFYKGQYGYEKDLVAARECQKLLAEKGDSHAISDIIQVLKGKLFF